ncbi:MAG TPA: phosphoribosylamine--glycine ligase [Pyrinomonadaceae bacterium]|nr:phosphoribosylamine--glycine ligase [Pyrinomonadaceae bacterium]
MKALVVGSGGREHAILATLRRTAAMPLELYCAPGNGGIAAIAECVPLSATDQPSLIQFAQTNEIDMTIVGPEGPLAEGIVDEFERNGLKIVGPSRAAARLESSKAFAKDFMRRHRIPTAEYQVANSAAEALEILRSGKFGEADTPVVIKADGLAAGKGVVVAPSRQAAEIAVTDLATGSLVPADAAKQILLEEALQGREVSVLLFADGSDYALMPAARDHKRVGENDTGPNTGGMGAITDTSVLDSKTLARIVREVIEPTLSGAVDEGFPFRGVLFVGLMLTADGPRVLEYNVRFGDPETQAILMRLNSDLFRVFQATIEGNLRQVAVEWNDQSSACVVLASAGYPGPYETGINISGLDGVLPKDNLQIFHAGTSRSQAGDFVTVGGRVLGVTAADTTLERALTTCYGVIDKISWPGMQYRRDIGRFNDTLKASN